MRLPSVYIIFKQCLTYKGQLVMRGPCMKRGMSSCPVRPVFRLQFLLKVGQCFRLVSPLRVRTGDAAASTELQHRLFYISPAHSTQNSDIRYTPSPPPLSLPTRIGSFHTMSPHHSSPLYSALCNPAHFSWLARSSAWLLIISWWECQSQGTAVCLRKHWNIVLKCLSSSLYYSVL